MSGQPEANEPVTPLAQILYIATLLYARETKFHCPSTRSRSAIPIIFLFTPYLL